MKWLGMALLGTGFATMLVGFRTDTMELYLLAAFVLAAAVAAFSTSHSSTYLNTVMTTFGWEAVGLGFCTLASAEGVWPPFLSDLEVPSTVVMSLAFFVVMLRCLQLIEIVRRALAIADRYFHLGLCLCLRLPGGLSVPFAERTMAQAAIAMTILLRQFEVILTIKATYVGVQFLDAIQSLDGERFWDALLVQMPLWGIPAAILSVGTATMIEAFAFRWRKALADDYARRWLETDAHYRMALCAVGIDNPDQRIQEDVPRFINGGPEGAAAWGIYTFITLITSLMGSFLAYAIILWNLSETIQPFGPSFHLPGFLLWFSLAWGFTTTALTFWVGKPLIPLSFRQQHYEADYRYSLARPREYSEQIALMGGGRTKSSIVQSGFQRVMRNGYALIGMGAVMNCVNKAFNAIKDNMHYLLLGPFLFTKQMTLGTINIASNGFLVVNAVFGFFSEGFTALASFKAVIDRLSSFDAALDQAQAAGEGIRRVDPEGDRIVLSDVEIRRPDGSGLSAPFTLTLRPGENVLITGSSGTGKSTLFRVLAGIWPSWSGCITLPAQAKLLILPQKSYLPVGGILAAVSYPEVAGTFERASVAEALNDVGLARLAADLDADKNWSQSLSGGEQQRLAIARAILIRPDWLLLDEATAALDLDLERQVYEVLARRLPETTLISIGHRDSLIAHHPRRLHVARGEGDGFRFVATPMRTEGLMAAR